MDNDEARRQIHDAIAFHRRVYENAIEPWLERLARLESLRTPPPIIVDREVAQLAGLLPPGGTASSADGERRPCTCPDGERPIPCPRKFAVSECQAAAGWTDSASACQHEWRPYAFHPNGGPASYYCPLCRVNRAPTATEIQKSSVPDQPEDAK